MQKKSSFNTFLRFGKCINSERVNHLKYVIIYSWIMLYAKRCTRTSVLNCLPVVTTVDLLCLCNYSDFIIVLKNNCSKPLLIYYHKDKSKNKIQHVWNAISTLIFSLMVRLHSKDQDTNWKVSNKRALTSNTEFVLRKQLIQANEQLSQEKDKSLCIICLDTLQEVKPCKHYCSCLSCTNRLRECPLCKRQIYTHHSSSCVQE